MEIIKDDTISRKAAIDALYELYHNRPLDYGRIRMRGDILMTIENVPSSKRRGRWLQYGVNYSCSVCNMSEMKPSPYCPNCGARMDEVENE